MALTGLGGLRSPPLILEQYGIVARQRTSIGFKLVVHGDSGAGGLVARLSCTAYFGKLAIVFGCSLPQQA